MINGPLTGPHFAEVVERRLETLRKICPLESVSEGRARLAAERPVVHESFDLAVERRLRELRALVELTKALHGKS